MTTRVHRYGNILTIIFIINDPAYLTEPYIRESSWVFDPNQVIPPFPCEITPDGTIIPAGKVPSFLPGKNDILHDFATEYGIPAESALGGAETTVSRVHQEDEDDEGRTSHHDGTLQAHSVNCESEHSMKSYEERLFSDFRDRACVWRLDERARPG